VILNKVAEMLKYALNPKKEKSVLVFGRGLRISRKNSTAVCRAISGKTLPKAMAFVERLVKGEHDIGGKHYTNASSEILQMLKSAQGNAEFKGLESDRLIKMRRQKRKVTNIQIVLLER
jgi:ribosomal protein L22